MVYFAQRGGDGPIKIGTARDPARRVAELQVAAPERIWLLTTVPGGRAAEAALHAMFADGHIAGEWFRADTPGLAAYIAGLIGATSPDPVRLCADCRTRPVAPRRRRYCAYCGGRRANAVPVDEAFEGNLLEDALRVTLAREAA